jgi:hypothetical protein
MLTFIAKNYKSNEKLIQDELGLKTSLLDFFASSDLKTISEKIESSIGEIKIKAKKDDVFYTKLIYYFSILVNSNSFKNDDKARTSIKNLIEICEPLVGGKVYQDLFNLFDQYQKEHKRYVLNQISLSKYDFSEDELISIYALFTMFLIDEHRKNKTYDSDVINQFADLIEKKKYYNLLRKIESTEQLREIIRDEMLKNKDVTCKNVTTSKLFFFLTLASPNLIDEDFEKYILNEKLVKEKKMMDDLNNRNDEEILFNSDNKKYFEDEYGEKGAEFILIGAKESCIHEILVGFEDDKKTNVSFKDFITGIYEDENEENESKKVFTDDEIQSKFEDIEDMLISGKEHNLYNIAVDYFKKEIKILYLRRPEYEKEQKANLLNKVKQMKAKLQAILGAIEKI